MTEPRNTIIWFSEQPPSPDLSRTVAINGCQLFSTTSIAKAKSKLPYSKGFIVEGNTPNFIIGTVRKINFEAGRHGIPIVATVSNTTSEKQLISRIGATMLPGSDVEGAPRILRRLPEWDKIVKDFVDFKHGPVYSQNLRVIVDDPSVREHHSDYLEDKFLLCRAFSDFGTIKISKLKDGYSGARIYKVIPLSSSRTLPFLMKINKPGKIAKEKNIFKNFVADTISFQHRPNFFLEQCFITPGAGVLVQDFIEKAIPLREALEHGKSAMLITSLFEGALQPWRLGIELRRTDGLANYFFPSSKKGTLALKGSKDVRPLEEARHWAMAEAGAKLDLQKLFSTLKSCFPTKCHEGRIHGDLHAGNIFVDAGTHEVVIIDFFTPDIGPSVLDPACLEVDIAFRANCPPGFIEQLYVEGLPPPAPSMRADGVPWVWEAIRAIRLFGRIDDADSKAYTCAVIGHLLRFASYEDNGSTEIRGRAYALAERLLTSLCP